MRQRTTGMDFQITSTRICVGIKRVCSRIIKIHLFRYKSEYCRLDRNSHMLDNGLYTLRGRAALWQRPRTHALSQHTPRNSSDARTRIVNMCILHLC